MTYDKSTVKKGDVIGVAYGNYISPAMFIKETPTGVHFHLLREGVLVSIRQRLEKGKKPYIHYISRKEDTAWVILNKEHLDVSVRSIYEKMYNDLKAAQIL